MSSRRRDRAAPETIASARPGELPCAGWGRGAAGGRGLRRARAGLLVLPMLLVVGALAALGTGEPADAGGPQRAGEIRIRVGVAANAGEEGTASAEVAAPGGIPSDLAGQVGAAGELLRPVEPGPVVTQGGAGDLPAAVTDSPASVTAVLLVRRLPRVESEGPVPAMPRRRWAGPVSALVVVSVLLVIGLVLVPAGQGLWRAGRLRVQRPEEGAVRRRAVRPPR